MADLFYQDAEGVHHKVTKSVVVPPAQDERMTETACGIHLSHRADQVNEADAEPGGDRCPECFTGRKGK